MPEGQHQLPSTLKRSPSPKAQRTHERTLEDAYAALRHSFETIGDHPAPKGHSGPSDARSEKGGGAVHRGEGASYGGVDADGRTREAPFRRAKRLACKAART
ncbi:MAG TPA: hypothetical protein VMU47_05310 [Caldimonas sp.]|nr:hypothetical protein [Caldimonas sp.]